MTEARVILSPGKDENSEEMVEIREDYFEELLTDRIRLNVLEDVHLLARTTSWLAPSSNKWFIQGKKWFSESVHGNDIREVIDSWIVMIAKKESES